MRNGESGHYDSDGDPDSWWGRYENDKWEGVWWYFTSSGASSFETYEAGVRNGESGSYDSDGEKRGCWRTYTNGQPGPGTYYHSDGSTGEC